MIPCRNPVACAIETLGSMNQYQTSSLPTVEKRAVLALSMCGRTTKLITVIT